VLQILMHHTVAHKPTTLSQQSDMRPLVTNLYGFRLIITQQNERANRPCIAR